MHRIGAAQRVTAGQLTRECGDLLRQLDRPYRRPESFSRPLGAFLFDGLKAMGPTGGGQRGAYLRISESTGQGSVTAIS